MHLNVSRKGEIEGDGNGQALTVENVGKLEREVSASGTSSEFKKRQVSALPAGSLIESERSEGDSGNGQGRRSAERPQVGRRWKDSERTVTTLDDEK